MFEVDYCLQRSMSFNYSEFVFLGAEGPLAGGVIRGGGHATLKLQGMTELVTRQWTHFISFAVCGIICYTFHSQDASTLKFRRNNLHFNLYLPAPILNFGQE